MSIGGQVTFAVQQMFLELRSKTNSYPTGVDGGFFFFFLKYIENPENKHKIAPYTSGIESGVS